MSHIFISYSRKDLDITEKIVNALAKGNLDTWTDWKKIPKGELFERGILQGIEEADVFLFLVSLDSVQSDWCNKEIAHAVKNGKRILPIFISHVEVDTVKNVFRYKEQKDEVFERNLIFCRDMHEFDKAIEEIQTTVHTDYEWLKYHTNLQVKALEWESKDTSRLLRGKELREAEQQLASAGSKDPLPTDLQRQYVLQSRRAETRSRNIVFSLGVIVVIALVIATIFSINRSNYATGQANAAQTSQANAINETHGRETALVNEKNARATAQANEATAIANQIRADKNAEEARKQALLATSKNLSALALTRIDIDYTQSLLLGVESFRLLEKNNLSQGRDPDILPTLLQKTQTGLTETLISPPTGTVWKVTYSKDGKFMASASDTIDLWDTTDPSSPKLIKSWNDSQNKLGASDVAFNTDGTILATGYWDGQVDLWSVKKLNKMYSFTDYRSDKLTKVKVAFNPDGRFLAISEGKKIILLDMKNPDAPQKLPGINNPQNNENVADLFFLPAYQNYLVSIGEDNSFHVWDLEYPENPKVFLDYDPTDEIISMALSPDSSYGFVMASNQYLYFYDSQFRYIERFYYLNDQSEPIYNMVFQQNKQRLFTASNNGTIALWDISNPRKISLITKYSGHANLINSMVFHPGGKIMASGGYDSKVVIWNIAEDATPALWQEQISYNIKINDIAYGPRNNFLAIGYDNSYIQLWNVTEPTFLRFVALRTIHPRQPVIKLTFTPDENILATLGGAFANFIPTAYTWSLTNIDNTKPQAIFELNTSEYFVVNEKYIIAGENIDNKSLSIYSWDISNRTRPAKGGRLDDAACPSKDTSTTLNGEIIAVASCSVQLWDFSDGKKPSIISELTPYDPQSVSFSWDGKILASGNGDNSITLWSISTSRNATNTISIKAVQLNKINNAHLRPVTSVAFSPDGKTLTSGGEDQMVNLWDISDPQNPVKKYSFKGNSNVILNGGLFILANKKILVSASQNEVIFWDINPQSWLVKACNIAGRNFTKLEWQQLLGKDIPYHLTCPQWTAGE